MSKKVKCVLKRVAFLTAEAIIDEDGSISEYTTLSEDHAKTELEEIIEEIE